MSPVPVLPGFKMNERDRLTALVNLARFSLQVQHEAKTLIGAVQKGLVAYRCDRKEEGWSALQDLSEYLQDGFNPFWPQEDSTLACRFPSKRISADSYVTAVLDPVQKGGKWQLSLKILDPLVAAMERRFAEILEEAASHRIQTLPLPEPLEREEDTVKELSELCNVLRVLGF